MQGPVFQRFHVYIHSQARFARTFSNKGDQEESTNQVKEAHGDKQGVKADFVSGNPIIRENRKLAIHAAEPRMPLTVAI
ncbi:Uncharacterised protein [Escherichia coli]|uniref:Uncharacterized protein n=1 Tax=Escherichia coli TaxID=562 RepID=A0A376MV74_ECOLX|nr:Uncharacterised protein [Escherichia coli]